MGLEEIGGAIRDYDHFIVTTHVNPDGDAIGSVLAFGEILRHFGKNYRVLLQDPFPPRFRFLSGFDETQVLCEVDTTSLRVDALVVIDSPTIDRIGDVVRLVRESLPIVNIDHHPDNVHFGTVNYLDLHASATSEIIYALAREVRTPITPALATQIYTSIMYDTGRFRFANTSSRALSVCSQMVEHGADPHEIANAVYFEKTFQTIKFLGAALESMELHLGGKACTMCLDYELLCSDGLDKEDLDGFVDYPLSVIGVEVAVFMREVERGFFRVSLRAKSEVHVNEVAAAFGGGGHVRAAGCRLEGTAEEVKARIISEIQKQL